MDVSLILPAFNEAKRLPPALGKLAAFRRDFPGKCEVIIVVEKSADGTLELAREAAAKQANFQVLAREEQRGKGSAVRAGMLAGQGSILFYSDVDLSVPLGEVHAFVAYLKAHPEVDVVIGSRQHPASQILVRQGWLRQRMGVMFNRLIRWTSGIEWADTQCGFKAFRRDAAQAIFARQRIDGFAFDVEVLLLAERLGYTVAELPVPWINSPESKVRIVRDSLRMVRDAVQIRRAIGTAETRRRGGGRVDDFLRGPQSGSS